MDSGGFENLQTLLPICGRCHVKFPSSHSCHFTLVGLLSPEDCLLKDAVDRSSANEYLLRKKHTTSALLQGP